MPPEQPSPPARRPGVVALLGAATALSVALALWGRVLCVDDYFRVYHALWWWERPAFAPSSIWLPLHAYLVGLVAGVTGNSTLAPRLASTGFALATWLIYLRSGRSPREGAARALLALALPTTAWLASSSLSEALYALLLVAALCALERHRESRRARDAVGVVLALALACAVRYEAWALAAPVTYPLLRRPTDGVRPVVRTVLVAGLAAFPTAWLVHSYDRTGDALAFLHAVETDALARPSLVDALRGPGWLVLALALVALGSLPAVFLRERERDLRSFAAASLLGFAVLGAMALRGQLPSQAPLRLLHAPTLLAVPVLARRAEALSLRALGVLAALGLALGAGYVALQPSALAPDTVALARVLAARLASDPRATAVVAGPFPEVSAFVVLADAPSRVHVDGAGRRCPVWFFTCEMRCATPPAWAAEVRYVLLAADSPWRSRLAGEGFTRASDGPAYTLLEAPRDGAPHCPRYARRGGDAGD